MFALFHNMAYRLKNGNITTLGKAIEEGGTPYTLPIATSSKLGGVKIGDNMNISEAGAISPDLTGVQDSINTINSSLTWKSAGTAGATVSLSGLNIKELFFICDLDTYKISGFLKNEPNNYLYGAYFTSNSNYGATIVLESDKIRIAQIYINGTDATSGKVLNVWYR